MYHLLRRQFKEKRNDINTHKRKLMEGDHRKHSYHHVKHIHQKRKGDHLITNLKTHISIYRYFIIFPICPNGFNQERNRCS